MPAVILSAALIIAIYFAWRSRHVTIIYQPNVGLLYRDGVFARELPAGRHSFFDPLKRKKVVKVSLADLPTPVGELTVLSKDKFSFRIALTPIIKVIDPKSFIESQSAVESQALGNSYYWGQTHNMLVPLATSAALEVAAAHTLQELLEDQELFSAGIQAKLAGVVPGASIARVLLASINLPPETRKMFTDVERARMEGQAGLERARGEQAALRVLANASRLLADNPALANLRLLQAIESSKGATTIVVGDPGALGAVKPTSAADKP